MNTFLLLFGVIFGHVDIVQGFQQQQQQRPSTAATTRSLFAISDTSTPSSRRDIISGIVASSTAAVATLTTSFPLTANAFSEEGFTKDERGFFYKVVTPGDDKQRPTARGQKVTISYTLSLYGFVDGKTSKEQGTTVETTSGLLGDKPITFPVAVSKVIKGWDYAVKDMAVGETRLLIVPPALGFGKNTMKASAFGGVDVPKDSTLYYEITLKEIGPVPVLTEDQKKWLEENPE